MARPIGIVTGLAFEAALVEKISKQMNWADDAPDVLCAGMGDKGAAVAAKELADRGVSALVSFGLAGGLDPTLEAGTLVLPDAVQSGTGQTYLIAPDWQAALWERLEPQVSLSAGVMFSSAEMISTPATKQAIWRDSGAVAADMESAQIAATAEAVGLAFLAVRAVADEAGEALPPAAAAMSSDGKLAVGALLTSLVRHPRQIPSLVELGRKTRQACSSLEDALKLGGPRAARRSGKAPA